MGTLEVLSNKPNKAETKSQMQILKDGACLSFWYLSLPAPFQSSAFEIWVAWSVLFLSASNWRANFVHGKERNSPGDRSFHKIWVFLVLSSACLDRPSLQICWTIWLGSLRLGIVEVPRREGYSTEIWTFMFLTCRIWSNKRSQLPRSMFCQTNWGIVRLMIWMWWRKDRNRYLMKSFSLNFWSRIHRNNW